jgi:hypothetical protein
VQRQPLVPWETTHDRRLQPGRYAMSGSPDISVDFEL